MTVAVVWAFADARAYRPAFTDLSVLGWGLAIE
jgi:hypothetical protein